MIIRTSYFSNPQIERGRGVAISRTQPRWWHGIVAPLFAPGYAGTFIQRPMWREEYIDDLFRRFPSRLSLTDALGRIHERTGSPLILLCYEPDQHQCHRSILAQFIGEQLGIEVLELSSPARAQIAAPMQMGLPGVAL